MELNTFGGLWSYASDLINSGYIVSRQVLNCSCFVISYEYDIDLGNHLSPAGVFFFWGGGGGWKDLRADQGSVMREYKKVGGGGGGIINMLRSPSW